MQRYEFADGLLQFLNAIAWVYGVVVVIGAGVSISEGQVQIGIFVGVVGIVTAVTLLAVGHVGRAVIDIAMNTAKVASQPPQPVTAGRPAPAVAPVTPQSSRPLASPPDGRRWGYLKEADPEIAAAADRLRAFGPELEAELAERVLSLGDKNYLPAIERLLTARATEEKRAREEVASKMTAAQAESVRRETMTYQAVVQANGGIDPGERVKVVGIEPYLGRWQAAQGGIKVTLANGKVILRKGGFARAFNEDPDADGSDGRRENG